MEKKVIHHINEIYEIVGDGNYQLYIVIIACLVTFPIGVQEFIMFFLAFDPGWKCRNGSTSCAYNMTILPTNTLYDERCHMNASADWIYAAQDKFSIVTEFDLICPREYWIETSSTIFYFGNLVGAVLFGNMSDRFGRSKVILLSYSMVLVSCFCTAYVPNLWLFEVFRFVSGLFISGTYMVIVILISEITSERLRASAGMIVWFSYSSGIAFSGVLAYYVQNWRRLLVYFTAPYIFIPVLLWFVPESFVWLHANGKREKLAKEIVRVVKINKVTLPFDIVFHWRKNNNVEDSTGLILKHFFKSKRLLMKTLSLMFAWFALGLVYFGVSLAADGLTGDAYRDFVILILVDIPSTLIAMFLSSRLGRKNTIISTMFSGGLCVLIVGFIPNSQKSGYATVRLMLGVTGKLLTTVSFDVIIIWCAELYPTKLRSNANGIFNSASIFGSVCSPWVGIWLRRVHKSVPFFTMGGCTILASLLLGWLPETRGKCLPEEIVTSTNKVSDITSDGESKVEDSISENEN